MSTYVILSKIAPDAFRDPRDFAKVAQTVAEKIKTDCPGVTWKDSYATTGRFDVIDIVESSELAAVERAAMLIRAYGHATTETMVATPWREFIDTLSGERTTAARVGTV